MGKLRLGGRGTCPRTHSKLETDWQAWPVLSRQSLGYLAEGSVMLCLMLGSLGHEKMAEAIESGAPARSQALY